MFLRPERPLLLHQMLLRAGLREGRKSFGGWRSDVSGIACGEAGVYLNVIDDWHMCFCCLPNGIVWWDWKWKMNWFGCLRMSSDVFGMPSGCLRDCLVNCFVWIWKGASISPVFSWHFECDIMTIVVLNCIVVCRWSNFLFVGDLPIVCWQMYCRRVACLSNLQFVFVRMQHSVVYLAKWMIFMAFFIRFTCFCILSICKKWFWKWLVGSMESKKYSFVLFFFDKIAKMYLKNHTFVSD